MKDKLIKGDTVGFNSKTPQWFQREYSSSVTGKIKEIKTNTCVIIINGIGKEEVEFKKNCLVKTPK